MNIFGTQTLTFRILRILAFGAGTMGFMMSTSPARLPAMLLVVPFAGMFATVYLVMLEMLRFLAADDDANGALLRMYRPRLTAAVIAAFPVLLLVLQSIVELTIWDVLIAVAILLLSYLYIARGLMLRRS